ncbi:FAD-dependent oxidoreductase [Aquabacterium fontiphilum]|uniref:NAD(P)/FAD-dependent oxidoreductase n=1 Tax=Aquabacterium fontiphilum TaxID=450365 RepID=UPI00137872D0|nr:FAD-dependent oxidoreductase [Aquabacterium fontiphilum]NBD20338.1 FAD-dependent oxidoreductase [Aquabacterium fontiphilum]
MNDSSSLQSAHGAAKVAVIGAGMAGLSCATALHEAGCRVTLFDKSRGPSGRMSTRRAEGWQCDHGAQYFTARDAAFAEQVQSWVDAGCVAAWAPRLRAWSREAGWSQPGEAVTRWVGTPRMTAPAAAMVAALQAAGHALHLQHTVTGVHRTTYGWRIRVAELEAAGAAAHAALDAGLDAAFDAVVLAVPSHQAVPLLQPVAPAWAEQVEAVRMRGSWALMLRYAQPVATGLGWEAAFVNTPPLRWVACDSHKPGRPSAQETWLLHADADWSDAHIEDTPESVAATLMAAAAELGLPPPQAWTAHRWRYADTAPGTAAPLAWDPALRLGLCGDWMNAGKVEGAWLSGRDAARQAYASLRQAAGANAMPAG